MVVDEGPGGLLGNGANGDVRRGSFRGEPVALKSLFFLRTDSATTSLMGGSIPPDQREPVLRKFMLECEFMKQCIHPNIVPFYGVVSE